MLGTSDATGSCSAAHGSVNGMSLRDANVIARSTVQKGPQPATQEEGSTVDNTSDNEDEGYTLISWGENPNPYFLPGHPDALTPPPDYKQGTAKHSKPTVRFWGWSSIPCLTARP